MNGLLFSSHRIMLAFMVCAWICAASAAQAEIYKFIDERGVCHYSNAPGDKRYKRITTNRSARSPKVDKSSSWTYTPTLRPLSLNRQSWNSAAYDQHIRHAARVHRVDPLLIKAIIKIESNFNRYAVSSKGAQGLMQLMPGTAKYLRVYDSFDPWQNIYGGTMYIRQMLDSFQGNLQLSLAAYNAGPTRVMKYKRVPRIPETIAYVRKVMRQYQLYQSRSAFQNKTIEVSSKTSIRVRRLVTVN